MTTTSNILALLMLDSTDQRSRRHVFVSPTGAVLLVPSVLASPEDDDEADEEDDDLDDDDGDLDDADGGSTDDEEGSTDDDNVGDDDWDDDDDDGEDADDGEDKDAETRSQARDRVH